MPDLIVLGELLVEVMREKVGVPHTSVGKVYRAPFPSGAPAIFASSAARMGKNGKPTVGYIGVVGDDDFGKVIIKKLRKDGVDISQIRKSEKHTGAAFVQYNEDGSRKFIFMEGAAGETSPEDVKKEYFKDVKAIHIMGSALSISERSRDATYKMIEVAKEANKQVEISFDPNIRPEMLGIEKTLKILEPVMENATIILPSGEEAEMLANMIGKGKEKACKEIFKRAPNCKLVLLKNGAEGVKIFQKIKKGKNTEINTSEISSYSVKEVDATGAGDSFGGAFISEYLNGEEVQKAVQFANAVGAMKVTHFGPMPDHSREAILKFMEKNKN